jgi:quinolinate synthase
MKSNSLEGILRVLIKPRPEDEVMLDEDVRLRAQRCIDAMFEYVERAPVSRAPLEIPS